MLDKLAPIDLVASVMSQIRENTGLECFDRVPINQSTPFYSVEMVGTVPEPSKTMQKDRYQLIIHCFASGPENTELYDMLHKLQEALSVEVKLPEPYEVTIQEPRGLNQNLEQVDGSREGIVGYDFIVFSGFKMKI